MSRWDFEIALVAWLASIGVVFALPHLILLIVFTTFNLWHQRTVLFNAGAKLAEHVHHILADDLAAFDERIRKFEKVASDIKESQNQIITGFQQQRRGF